MGSVEGGDLYSQTLSDWLLEKADYHSFSQEAWQCLEEQMGEELYSELLYFLTNTRYNPKEARQHWERIQTHQKKLHDKVGREVGLGVALADYFVNICPTIKCPVMVDLSQFIKQKENALRDELTGLYNRRFFNQMLKQEVERARRYKESLSLLMVDVDHFKAYNDQFGHPTGDQALAQLAEVFQNSARAIDHLTRYGGEEFAIILPRANHDEALVAAERHRRGVERATFPGDSDHQLTVSIGAATYPYYAQDGFNLLAQADKALYGAKGAGRNRVLSCGPNTRRHLRYPLETSFSFRRQSSMSRRYPGKTRNISAGGMLGEIKYLVDVGEMLDIWLNLPGENGTIELCGRCIRKAPVADCTTSMQIGVCFDLHSAQQQANLGTLIEELRL